MADVARQTAEAEREFCAEVKECAEKNEHCSDGE